MLEEIKKISIFIVAAQMILHLCAGKQYQKYIKLLISIMIMVQFLLPILSFLRVCTEGEFWATVEQYEREIADRVEEVSREYTGIMEDEIMNLAAEEVKRQIQEAEAGEYILRLEYNEGRYKVTLRETGPYDTREWEKYFATLLGTDRKNVEVILSADES